MQARAQREAGAKGLPEVAKGNKMSLQAQKKQPWANNNYGRDNQRVRGGRSQRDGRCTQRGCC